LVRIRFKNTSSDEENGFISFDSLYPNDIYPSVSRRFTGRESINVWTSGTRVWHCNNPRLLNVILQNWERRSELSCLVYDALGVEVDKDTMEQVIILLEETVKAESNEYGRWL
jgi:hypothetical protein